MNRTTTHPGDVLKEELEARGISQKKFSDNMSAAREKKSLIARLMDIKRACAAVF